MIPTKLLKYTLAFYGAIPCNRAIILKDATNVKQRSTLHMSAAAQLANRLMARIATLLLHDL